MLHVTHAGPFNLDGWPLRSAAMSPSATMRRSTAVGSATGYWSVWGRPSWTAPWLRMTSIAAGALVTPGKRLRSGYLYAGSPAREVRALSDKEMAYFCYSAGNYVRLRTSTSRRWYPDSSGGGQCVRICLITGGSEAHPPPDIERLCGLLDQHAQAIGHRPRVRWAAPAHERRGLGAVHHVVATTSFGQHSPGRSAPPVQAGTGGINNQVEGAASISAYPALHGLCR